MTRDWRRARDMVVVAPHPDDDVIGAFGLMRGFRGRVRVVVVSDGGASHPGSATWPRARLVARREREARAGLAVAGVRRVSFLRRRDGELEGDAGLAVALRRVVRGAGLVVGPIAEDAHADHRAVAAALARAVPRGTAMLGYGVWPAGRGPRMRAVVRLDAAARAAKRRAIACHATQTGGIRDAVAGFTMTWRHVARFVRPVERFAVLR